MLSFLLEHYFLSGIALAAVLAFVGAGAAGGWALVLNRRVLGALALLLAAVAFALWVHHRDDRLREEGRQAVEEANRLAHVKRQEEIADFVVTWSKREGALRNELASKEHALWEAQQKRERSPGVSRKADAACPVPLGFVRDHDSALPRSAGSPRLPPAGANLDDPSGVVLSGIARCVGRNYTECAKLEERLASCEERRYRACLEWDKRFGTESGCTR